MPRKDLKGCIFLIRRNKHELITKVRLRQLYLCFWLSFSYGTLALFRVFKVVIKSFVQFLLSDLYLSTGTTLIFHPVGVETLVKSFLRIQLIELVVSPLVTLNIIISSKSVSTTASLASATSSRPSDIIPSIVFSPRSFPSPAITPSARSSTTGRVSVFSYHSNN